MDNSSSERSPSYTDSSPGSFGQMKFWESDASTNTTSTTHRRKPIYPLFGLDHVKEIEGLVEDKDVASKAVTFVVNGTRKGVVPLCADVAGLMRAHKRLEQIVEKQRREIEHLRSVCNSSLRTSRSTSPTPPSINSDDPSTLRKLRTDQFHPCSRCSPSSSYASSPHLSQSLEQSMVSIQSEDVCHDNSHDHLHPNRQVIRAEVHPIPPKETKPKNHEIIAVTTQVSNNVPINDTSVIDEKQYKHTDTFQTTDKCQHKLEEDLEDARKEIERLQCQLHESPPQKTKMLKQVDTECEMRIVDEIGQSVWYGPPTVNLPHIEPNVVLVRQTNSSPIHCSTCHCRQCTFHADEHSNGQYSTPSSSTMDNNSTPQSLEQHSNSFKYNRLHVQLNNRVVIQGGRIGHVRYIGPLHHGNSNTTYLGLQLEEPYGRHDGIHNGKRYFWCHRNHGIFIPIQDVISVIKSKPSKLQTVHRSRKNSADGSKKSSNRRDSSGSRNRVAPARLPTPPTTAKPTKEFVPGT